MTDWRVVVRCCSQRLRHTYREGEVHNAGHKLGIESNGKLIDITGCAPNDRIDLIINDGLLLLTGPCHLLTCIPMHTSPQKRDEICATPRIMILMPP